MAKLQYCFQAPVNSDQPNTALVVIQDIANKWETRCGKKIEVNMFMQTITVTSHSNLHLMLFKDHLLTKNLIKKL